MDTTSLTASLSKTTITPTELARRAGVSRNTEWSLRRDPSRAKLGTLRELALACGLDIRIATVEASDPYAAAAARVMVGDLLADDVENEEQLTEWVARLKRWAPDAQPLQLTKMAAEVSAAAAVELHDVTNYHQRMLAIVRCGVAPTAEARTRTGNVPAPPVASRDCPCWSCGGKGHTSAQCTGKGSMYIWFDS